MLLQRISKYSLKKSYSYFRATLKNSRYLATTTISTNRKPKNDEEKNAAEELFRKYDETLLYNSYIDSKKLKVGYATQQIILSKESKKEAKLKLALQTIQPLPIALKYVIEKVENKPNQQETIDQKLNNTEQENEYPFSFPYTTISTKIANNENMAMPQEPTKDQIKLDLERKKEILDNSSENWMSHYENYENDLIDYEDEADLTDHKEFNIDFGTPDPNISVSTVPCGGCGALLHCKDASIPGYIPSEIFKNCSRHGGATLKSIYCKRCHFLKEYNIALNVNVSSSDYPKVLEAIPFSKSLAILLVDLTDFPCSIWPGIADIIGPRAPLIVVGNKVDLLPKDNVKFLQNVREVLTEQLKLSGFVSANIKGVQLISSKTGYGVEKLISIIQDVWKRRGDIYIIGCTNVGKSSLFNLLLKSDFCKIQAADLVQRATTSPWPGTTLNLLKFPITRFSGYRLYARQKRLEELKSIEKMQEKLRPEALAKSNSAENATLKGIVERSIQHLTPKDEIPDNFTIAGRANITGITRMGIDENHKDFVSGKWCYDTPGVVHPDQILHLLTADELLKTLPKEIIRPETFSLKPGLSLFIAGLARMDFLEGTPTVRATVFRSKSLPITVCYTTEADKIYKELVGTEFFAVPIFDGDRASKWPNLELAKTFKLTEKKKDESSYDIVLSSAGWVALELGYETCKFNAWTPEKRGVFLRDSLLPKAVKLRGSKLRGTITYKKTKFI